MQRLFAASADDHAAAGLRRLIACALGLALAAAGSAAAQQPPVPEAARELFAVKTTVAAVDLYTPADPAAPRRVGALVFEAGLQIHGDDARFGGWSGLLLDPAGRTLLAVSDNGFWLHAEITRDAAGIPRGLARVVMGPIRDIRGATLDPVGEDAEALAWLHGPRGPRVVVAFERWHRLWAYPDGPGDRPLLGPLLALPEPVKLPQRVLRHPANAGLEAVVEIAPGRLLLFSEGARADEASGALRAWLADTRTGEAAPLALRPVEEGFAPTDAALLEGCCVLLLERRYRVLEGPAAAVRAIPLADIRPGAVLQGRLLARLQPPMTVDNFEGLAVERTRDGAARLLLLSDDNYRSSQRTLLMAFLWEGAPRSTAAHEARRAQRK